MSVTAVVLLAVFAAVSVAAVWLLLHIHRKQGGEARPAELAAQPQAALQQHAHWFLGVDDAQHLAERLRAQEAGWSLMMSKEVPGKYRYTAYKRGMPSGLTEYLTTLTCPNVSTFEFSEFLMDDRARRNWESFCKHVSILDQGDWLGKREQVVRWVRRFPFHFLTDREYIIASQLHSLNPHTNSFVPLSEAKVGWEIYACTRGLEDYTPPQEGLVRTAQYNSNWCCRSVPWPGGGCASEVVLLHSEDLKIPGPLARWAIQLGMGTYLRELTDGLQAFVTARREQGVPSDALDPQGYGHNFQEPLRTHQSIQHTSATGSNPERPRDSSLPAASLQASFLALEAPHLHTHALKQSRAGKRMPVPGSSARPWPSTFGRSSSRQHYQQQRQQQQQPEHMAIHSTISSRTHSLASSPAGPLQEGEAGRHEECSSMIPLPHPAGAMRLQSEGGAAPTSPTHTKWKHALAAAALALAARMLGVGSERE